MSRTWLAPALVLGVLAALLATPAPPAPASGAAARGGGHSGVDQGEGDRGTAGRTWRRGECRSDRGVTVVIDFRSLGHRRIVRCVTRRVGRGFTGQDALRAADIRVRGVDNFGRAFVCRLQRLPTARMDLLPGPGSYHERCHRVPPTTAYWSYWSARDGRPWRYSTVGYSRPVVPGGFEGWSFHVGRRSAKPPRWTPNRPGRDSGGAGDVAGREAVTLPRDTPAGARSLVARTSDGRRGTVALRVTSATDDGTASLTGGRQPAGPAPRAARLAVGWLIGDLRAGRLPGPGGRTDWGLTIDALWAMHAAGAGSTSAARIVRALGEGVDDYIGARGYGDRRTRVAGATAKVLLAAAVTGRNTARFGGYDLRAEVLGLMQGPGRQRPGRFSDLRTGFDSSNTISQATAVLGLALTGGVPARAVRFLRQQQCPGGGFRMYADQGRTCAQGPAVAGAPDVDGTAMAVQALLAARAGGAHRLDGPIARALGWLVAQQQRNGSYAGGQFTQGSNANSTGLAAQALLAGGRTAAAAEASRWLRSLQLREQSVQDAPAGGEAGAVAYDRPAYDAARSGGIDGGLRDQWRRATAQAVLGLAGVSFLDLGSSDLADDPQRPAGTATPLSSASASTGTTAPPSTGTGTGPVTGWLPFALGGLLAVGGATAVGWRLRRRPGLTA